MKEYTTDQFLDATVFPDRFRVLGDELDVKFGGEFKANQLQAKTRRLHEDLGFEARSHRGHYQGEVVVVFEKKSPL